MTLFEEKRGLGHIRAIDGLRAIAVGSVVLFHLWPRLLPGGFTGVDVFFVISGFVVTGSLMGREFSSLRDLAAYFYARRLMRIMPALVVMLLVMLLATQLLIPEAWLSNSIPQTARFAFFGLSNVVLATDTDSYFGPQAEYNPFTHSWSLGVEEQFYTAFPFLLYWHQRLHAGPKAVRLIAALSAVSLLLCAVLGYFAAKFAFYLVITRFWELGAGMLLCLTRQQWQPWAARQRWLAPLGALLLAAGFAVGEGSLFPFPLALLPVLGTAAMIAAIVAGRAPRLLESRAMVGVGLLSYSLYLWHWPVFVLFRWTSGLHSLPLQLAALGLAVLLACASYFLVERPLRANPAITAQPRGRIVGGILGTVLVAALLGHLLIAAHDRITLNVTHDRHAWYAEETRALDPARSRCGVEQTRHRLAGGKLTLWKPDCAPARAAFTLFVPADSHGLAYTPALRQLAAEKGAVVRHYFRASCPYLKLIESHASHPHCTDWYAAVLADIRANARPGDVVFLPGLRLSRIANQFENETDVAVSHADTVTPTAEAEARTLLADIAATGARILLEQPKPLFPSPAFRCTDWFNRANPMCRGLTIPRSEMLARRLAILLTMDALAAAQPALALWDPLPLLCPGDPCEAVPDGRPLFFDGDHLSGLGNDRIYPSLRDTILRVRHQPPPNTRLPQRATHRGLTKSYIPLISGPTP